MSQKLTVTCCSCGSKTTVIIGIASTLICQQCGGVTGIIKGKQPCVAFCPKCGVYLEVNFGKKTRLRCECGSQVIKIIDSSAFKMLNSKTTVEKGYILHKKYQKTSIIIPIWGNFELTKKCIESIREFTKIPYQLITIVNGFDLEMLAWLRRDAIDDDIIIVNSSNIGFASSCNQGLKLSSGCYILFLNNDTIINAFDWLPKLIKGLTNANLVGPTCSRVMPNKKDKIFRYIGAGKENDRWSYIEGWCLFAKKKLFEKIGGFDERFKFAYAEDADLSFRVKKAGKKILRVKTPVTHIGQQSAKMLEQNNPGQNTINNMLLYRKWISNG